MLQGIWRLFGWGIVACLSLAGVAVLSPQQLGILVYKLCLVSFAVVLAYWADRVLFRYAPKIDATLPHDALGAARLVGRALIALGIILGLTFIVGVAVILASGGFVIHLVA